MCAEFCYGWLASCCWVVRVSVAAGADSALVRRRRPVQQTEARRRGLCCSRGFTFNAVPQFPNVFVATAIGECAEAVRSSAREQIRISRRRARERRQRRIRCTLSRILLCRVRMPFCVLAFDCDLLRSCVD